MSPPPAAARAAVDGPSGAEARAHAEAECGQNLLHLGERRIGNVDRFPFAHRELAGHRHLLGTRQVELVDDRHGVRLAVHAGLGGREQKYRTGIRRGVVQALGVRQGIQHRVVALADGHAALGIEPSLADLFALGDKIHRHLDDGAPRPDPRGKQPLYIAAQGFFARRLDSDAPYLVDFGEFEAGVVDFTNPGACAWFAEEVIGKRMLDFGLDGWMADFGEYLPTDLRLFAGDGAETAGALKTSQLALMDDADTSHPFYWSAFAVVGDGAARLAR